jgi:hypothetical protein
MLYEVASTTADILHELISHYIPNFLFELCMLQVATQDVFYL